MERNLPKKRFGQHFLIDKNIAQKIVLAINSGKTKSNLILEIGPGKGILTEYLLQTKNQYLGIEIDKVLAKALEVRFSHYNNFSLITGDFLNIDFEKTLRVNKSENCSVIGNIPYNITSLILFKLFDNGDLVEHAVLMMQKEVAQRVTGKPGTKEYGIL